MAAAGGRTAWDFCVEYNARFSALDEVDIRIIQALAAQGPRNLSNVASLINIPRSSFHNRLALLRRKCSLTFMPIISWNKLGLKLVVTLITPDVRNTRGVLNLLRAVPYQDAYFRVYTPEPSFLFTWRIPEPYLQKFMGFLEEVKHLRLLTDPIVEDLGNPEYPGLNFRWYDPKAKAWLFNWDEIRHLLTHSLPTQVTDPYNHMLSIDQVDLLILDEMLMKSSQLTYTEIAERADLSPVSVRERVDKMFERGVIRGHRPVILPFPPSSSRLLSISIDFRSNDELEVFASGMSRVPVGFAYQKKVGKEGLMVRTSLPSSEMPNLVSMLTDMAEDGFIDRFRVYELDMGMAEAFPLPVSLFRKGWRFSLPSLEALQTVSG